MKVQSTNNQVNFTAKFFHSDALKKVAEYSVEHGKFDKLNQARINIDKASLRTRFLVDIGEHNGKPFVSFSSFAPKRFITVPRSMEDCRLVKTIKYVSENEPNILKFALQKIIKLGNCVPKNNMFQSLVGRK